jgi:phage terminase large subunit GpA-like protein
MTPHQTAILRNAFRSHWKPEPDCPVWLWCENNIVLSPMESADMAGPFSSAVTPFIREPLECFRDGTVSEVTLVFATQVVKTLMIMLGVAWWLDHHSGRCIWVMDSADNARSFSETRWQPLIRDCPALAALMPSDRDEFKNLQQRLGNSLIHFVGSNSPGNLSSRPADLAVMDEVDKFATTTAREANAVDLVEQRTKSRANTKIIKTSSPTDINGLIWKSWLQGDQRIYLLPCPNCSEMIELDFQNVRWEPTAKTSNGWNFDLVQKTARYICQKCGKEIHDGQKTAMLRAGKWIPQNPDAPAGVRSYHLNSLYSPWSKTTFGNLAVEFLKHKARFDMKGWDNGYMARPTEEEAKRVDWEIIAARREKYNLGEIPEPVALLTSFCDVQDTWLEYFVWGWADGSESWLIEHHTLHGDPAAPDVWQALAELITAQRGLPVDWTFIDYGGHHGQQAIEFVKRMGSQRVYLHKGSTIETDPVNGRVTKTRKPITRLFLTGVGSAKRTIMSLLSTESSGPGYCHFPGNIDDEFFKQLCAEELRTKYQKGHGTEYWYQTRARNEALDGFTGCYAGLKRLNEGIIKRRFAERKERQKPDTKKPEISKGDTPVAQKTEKPISRNIRRRPGRGWMSGY